MKCSVASKIRPYQSNWLSLDFDSIVPRDYLVKEGLIVEINSKMNWGCESMALATVGVVVDLNFAYLNSALYDL